MRIIIEIYNLQSIVEGHCIRQSNLHDPNTLIIELEIVSDIQSATLSNTHYKNARLRECNIMVEFEIHIQPTHRQSVLSFDLTPERLSKEFLSC